MSYATLEQLKVYLKIPNNVTIEDVLLQSFLDEANILIDGIIGMPSAAEAVSTRVFDSPAYLCGNRVLFGGDCVTGITNIVRSDTTVITPSQYVGEPSGAGPYFGLRLVPGVSFGWGASVAVTGFWAWSKPDGKPDALIVGACRTLAAWMYREKDNVGTLAGSADGVTVVEAALPRNVLNRIKGRRRL